MDIHVVSDTNAYVVQSNKLLGTGETARVFLAHQEGADPLQTNYAVKLAKDQRHNVYIEQEYETLTRLHQILSPHQAEIALPLPTVELGMSKKDDRKALIMEPVLEDSLLGAFEKLDDLAAREGLAIEAAKQYATLLQALVDSNKSCRDRKLGDLWWVPGSGRLIVTDWNVVDEFANPIADIRRFGLLWFELVIGNQMPSHFRPTRKSFKNVQDKVSYGLWYVISRAIGSSIGSQFSTIQELFDALNDLSRYYHRSPRELINDAQFNLWEAHNSLDRTKADLAWIQFDLVERRGTEVQITEIEQARLWAQDPVAQAAPNFLEQLSSFRFSQASEQLVALGDKVEGPQELGDIERLSFGFELVGTVQNLLIETGEETIDLAQASEKLSKVQKLLAEGVLDSLMEKDGSTARPNVQRIRHILEPYTAYTDKSIRQLDSLDQEALFWQQYMEAHQVLDTDPNSAMSKLKEAKITREQIVHWPALYKPTAQDIDRLIESIESDLLSAMSASESLERVQAKEAQVFVSGLNRDLAKERWTEAIVELVDMLNQHPENDEIREMAENLVKELLQEQTELAMGRPSPAQLAKRIRIIKALLPIKDLVPDLLQQEKLDEELKKSQETEQEILRAQKELFQNPAQVLERAVEGKYELFDDPTLSVAALKAVHDVGRWDSSRLEQETSQVQEQAERLVKMTNVLDGRRREIEETISTYTQWQKESLAEDTAFLAKMLQLYLAAALAQIEDGENADKSLAKVKQLLAYARPAFPPSDYTRHRNLYQYLVELKDIKLLPTHDHDQSLESLSTRVTSERLEELFKEKRFEECSASLEWLSSQELREEWGLRVDHAIQLGNIVKYIQRLDRRLFRESSFLQASRKRKKNQINVYTSALQTLGQSADEFDPMAYELYQREIQGLYGRIWSKLQKLDRKTAEGFDKSIEN